MPQHYFFDRQLWEKEYFTDKHPYGWRCSKCGIGELRTRLEANSKTKSEKRLLRSSDEKCFVALMRCTNPDCNSVYSVAGRWGKYGRSGGELSIKDRLPDTRRFFPNFVEPPILFFSCDPNVPLAIVERLAIAFQLFWGAPAACANAIRSTLECLMDSQNVLRQNKESLHARILRFQKQDSINGKHLLAVKWIGNEGSHDIDLKRSDVIDGFELLATVLSNLYPDLSKNQRIEQITNSVNSTKKPRSKQR